MGESVSDRLARIRASVAPAPPQTSGLGVMDPDPVKAAEAQRYSMPTPPAVQAEPPRSDGESTIGTRLKDIASRIGSVFTGDKVSGRGLGDLVTGAPAKEERPGFIERTARNVAQGVPIIGPFTDEIGAAMEAPFSDKTYDQIRDEQRKRNDMAQQDAPFESGLVRGAAGMVGGGALMKGAQTATQVAGRMAGIGAVEGAGRSEATDAAGVLRDAATSGLVSGVTGGVVSKVIRGAPERVDAKVVRDVSRGEAGGATKDKNYKKLVDKAGEGLEDLNEVLGRHAGTKKLLATTAANNPAKAAAKVEQRIEKVGAKLDPIYDAIDATGGVSRVSLHSSVAALTEKLKKSGNTGMADVADRFRAHIEKHYPIDGTGGNITASQLRQLRNEIGEAAFAGDPTQHTKFGARAKQSIYGALNNAIESAAKKTPGVKVEELRTLNKDMSMFLTIKDALSDRAAKAAAGRSTIQQVMTNVATPSTLAVIGGAGGGLDAAAAGGALGLGVLAARKLIGPSIKATDYQLGELVRASRAGSPTAKIAQLALELGLSREVADQVASRLTPARPNEP